MKTCPHCGHTPDEEPEPLFPDVGPGPFIPRVRLVGGANLDALVGQRLAVDFNIDGTPISARFDVAMPPDGEPTISVGSTEDEP